MGAQHLDAAAWSGEGGASPLDDDVAAVLGVDPRAFQRTPAAAPRARPAPRHLARGVWIPVALAVTAGASALLVLLPARPPATPQGPLALAPVPARPMAQMLVDAPAPRATLPAAAPAPATPAAVAPPVAAPTDVAPTDVASNGAPDADAVARRRSTSPRPASSRRTAGVQLASRTVRGVERRHTPGAGDRAWSPHDHFASDADAAYSPGRPFPVAPALRSGGARDVELADLGRAEGARRSLVITPDGGRERVAGLHGLRADRLDRLQSPEVVRSVRIDAVDAIRLLRQK